MARLFAPDLEDGMKRALQNQARCHGDSTDEGFRKDLHHEGHGQDRATAPLGSRIAALFTSIGLNENIPEQRYEPPDPAELEG